MRGAVFGGGSVEDVCDVNGKMGLMTEMDGSWRTAEMLRQ